MSEKQLPPLPTLLHTRVVDGIPCISVSEHEYQMREYALQTIANAAQPSEVTDEQIESCALEAGFSVESTGSIWAVDGYVGTRVDPGLRKFARAILALRPVQVPITCEQVFASDELMALNGSLLGLSMCDLMRVIRIIEAHHGITANAKKEGA